jgi:NhaP-type Na+/H+ or K+/H+ antiporter
LIGVCRTALVAFIIVMIFEEAHSSWTGAIYRMISVVLGCLIGLVINYTFRRFTLPMLQRERGQA